MASPEEDVKYDTAAFGFFMLTGLFMYIVPSAIYTVRRLYQSVGSSADVANVC